MPLPNFLKDFKPEFFNLSNDMNKICENFSDSYSEIIPERSSTVDIERFPEIFEKMDRGINRNMVIDVLKSSLVSRNSPDKFRSAKNLVLSILYLSMSEEQRNKLHSLISQMENSQLNTYNHINGMTLGLSKNTILNYLNYLGTDRFKVNTFAIFELENVIQKRYKIQENSMSDSDN